jgi:ribokinase
MILVVGRPGLDEHDGLARLAGLISSEIARAGGRVELVGSVGDDPDGERVALALGQAGVGHAALLRDPAGVTPRVGGPGGPLPRLDEGDVELGLNYLVECRALILAEPAADGVQRVVAEAAAFHGAPLILVVDPGQPAPSAADGATVLEQPAGEDTAFAALVARYATALAAGEPAREAWSAALRAVGGEQVESEAAG